VTREEKNKLSDMILSYSVKSTIVSEFESSKSTNKNKSEKNMK